MSLPIKLPSGTILDWHRLVALFPSEDAIDGRAELILDGSLEPIPLDPLDVEFIEQFLDSKRADLAMVDCQKEEESVGQLDLSVQKINSHDEVEPKPQWNRELQLRQNQPLMKLIQEWRASQNTQLATAEDQQEYWDIQKSLQRKS
jgi:hypothetical protein